MKTKIVLLATCLFVWVQISAQTITELETLKPDAIVDLSDSSAVSLVKGKWRYQDAAITEVAFKAAGADRKPSGPANITNDIIPKAGIKEFDDSKWEIIEPNSLDKRRGNGKVSFNWYRFKFTIPVRLGSLNTEHGSFYFEIVVDDYAEVWVNGSLQKTFGQKGNGTISGYNSRNRILLTEDAVPGTSYQLAIFGINGPLSDIPENYIWIRSATLDFYTKKPLPVAYQVYNHVVERIDPALDKILDAHANIEKLAGGFQFTEGPVWSKDGYLLFSDPNANVIYRYTKEGDITVFRTKSGYKGLDINEYHQPGSNGLAYDQEGRLTICEHGNRRISRLEKNGVLTILADRYEGKRLNSPNDLVYKSDGKLYFTDPVFGLPKLYDDPKRECPYTGVYCLNKEKLMLVSNDLKGPNGIAFSPDEKYFYVTNWDEKKKVIMRYEAMEDGSLKNGHVFFDMKDAPEEEALDGLKIDTEGNLFVSGPGGIWIISKDGTLLGKIKGPELAANFAWGDDGKSLYLCARTGLYRIHLLVTGKLAALK